MDFKSKTTPEKGIQDVSFPVFSKPLGSANSGTKENKQYHEPQSVVDLKKEISDLTGRLFEARSSRDTALRKNVQMQEDHLRSLKQMQDVISRLEGNNNMLQKERDVDTFSRLADLEDEVEKVRCEKTDLRLRMDNVAKDNLCKDEKINELNQTIRKLEGSLRSLENQKSDLIECANEQLQRDKEFEMQKGALIILEQQLNKCQFSWEQTKDDLNEEKIKNRDLERMLASMEKELTTFKVDVRLLTKDKKELEDKLTKETSSSASSSGKIKELQHGKFKAEGEVKELGAEVKSLKTKLEEQVSLCAQKEKLLEERGTQKRKVADELRAAIKELEESKTLLAQYEKFKSSNTELQDVLKEKDKSLAEKDKTIARLQKNAKLLQEACVLLENQLKEFESLFSQQQQDLDAAIKAKGKADEEIIVLREYLRKAKIASNEMQSLKLYSERRLADVESTLKSGEAEKLNEIENLKSKMVDLKRSNDFMTEKMADLLDRLDELQKTSDDAKRHTEVMSSENKLLREESTRSLTEIMKLKETNSQLKAGLEQAISKCETYKGRFESVREDLALFEVGQAEKELRLQSTMNQQIKLIEHLKDQNEFLSAKKKRNFAEKFFSREHKENKESATPLSHLTKPIPASTPRRLIQEHKVVKNLEEEAANLKHQLAQLQTQKEVVNHEADEQTEDESIEEKGNCPTKTCIFRDEGSDRLDVNCVKNICGDTFLFGCEQGLYSRKSEDKASNYVVEIEGSGPVYQIDFILSLNYAILIEGKDRKLAFVHLSLLRACAEAAACSKPKIKLQYVADLKDCHSFQVQKTADGVIYAAVALPKYLILVYWDKDNFIVQHRLKTPDVVTSMLATPSSVIFGCDKIFELDIKNFTMEDFMDESDESIMYAMLSCRESFNYPVAILDVSRSNMARGDTTFRIEYLLCFPDFAIFVDAYGRRSRSEDIMWSKMPLGVYFKDPNLFVIHFNSVEVVEIGPMSYTKTRVMDSLDSIGSEVMNIPESKFISLPNARYLGHGDQEPVLLAGTLTKSTFEIFEVEPSQSRNAL